MTAQIARLRWLTGVLIAVFLLWGGSAQAQTGLVSTTLAAALTTADGRVVNLTSGTGVTAGVTRLWIDREFLLVQSAVGSSTTLWNVVRGFNGISTPHLNGARVYLGIADRFYNADVVEGAACTTANELFFPHINPTSGQMAECEAGFWAIWSKDPHRVKSFTLRDTFDGGQLIMQDDGTAKSLADAEENFVYGSPLGPIEYREDVAKTVSSWVAINGDLQIDADDAAEGVEFVFGASSDAALNQVIEVGTSGGCIAAMVTLSVVTGIDELQLGWRQNEAFVDVNVYASYDEWAVIGLVDNAGDLDVQDEEAGAGTQNDDTGITWAAAEQRGLKVCISEAGAPTFFYTAAAQANPDRPLWVEFDGPNTGDALTSGDGMVPFLEFLGAGVASTITLQWVELTRLP